MLAAFAVEVLASHSPLTHLVVISLIFTLGAGLVARIAVRPMICVGSLLLATVPTIIFLIQHAGMEEGSPLHQELFIVEAFIMACVTAISLQSVLHLYRSTLDQLRIKHEFGQLARHDELTGLANRLLLRERFEESRRAGSVMQAGLALHFLDLDGFKAVNDLYGHPIGDALLREVAARLKRLVRTDDTVGRLGGDEFVIIQYPVRNPQEAELLARRLIRDLSTPYEQEESEIGISASVGIALADDEGGWEELCARADEALYAAKSAGKKRFSFARPRQNQIAENPIIAKEKVIER
ncbi:MAG: GGDEF domain-containing protein [Sphingobium sp.]